MLDLQIGVPSARDRAAMVRLYEVTGTKRALRAQEYSCASVSPGVAARMQNPSCDPLRPGARGIGPKHSHRSPETRRASGKSPPPSAPPPKCKTRYSPVRSAYVR